MYYFVTPSPTGSHFGSWSRRTYKFWNEEDRDDFAAATFEQCERRACRTRAMRYWAGCTTYDSFYSYWYDRIANSYIGLIIMLILILVGCSIPCYDF